VGWWCSCGFGVYEMCSIKYIFVLICITTLLTLLASELYRIYKKSHPEVTYVFCMHIPIPYYQIIFVHLGIPPIKMKGSELSMPQSPLSVSCNVLQFIFDILWSFWEKNQNRKPKRKPKRSKIDRNMQCFL
jgi:hypothetical protein